jgi:hypothetical protein
MKFDSLTLNRLKRLQLVAQQIKRGAIKGDRRSSRRGQSIEFADYRDYVPGDDLRRLDWNIYARHERPFIKLMEDEEDLAVYIVLDGSASMDWGEGDENKLLFGKRLAAGLGVISLFTGDLLKVEVWGGEKSLTTENTESTESQKKQRKNSVNSVRSVVNQSMGPMRGGANLIRLLSAFDTVAGSGEIDFERQARQFTAVNKRPGLLIIISDFLYPNGYENGLKHLQAQGHEIILLHTLTEDERHPDLNGDLRLVDVETGNAQEVSLTRWMRERYVERLEAWQADLRAFAHQRGMRYFDLSTASEWDHFLLYELRKSGALA